jgi:hypothetical protein
MCPAFGRKLAEGNATLFERSRRLYRLVTRALLAIGCNEKPLTVPGHLVTASASSRLRVVSNSDIRGSLAARLGVRSNIIDDAIA